MRHRVRTRLGILAAVGVVLALAAGCGRPGDVDGNLTNGWGPMAPATGFEPKAWSCHNATFNGVGARSEYEEVDCKTRHRTETVYVGQYESPAADAAQPPADGSAGSRLAYQTCDQKTTTYVGGEWHNARLWIGVVNPTAAAWSGGERWYRCDVVELSSIEDDGGLVQRTGSLSNVLASGTSDLLLHCYAVQVDSTGSIESMPPVKCTAQHNAEYVGLWYAGNAAYPTDTAGWNTFHDGCRTAVATYASIPDDKDLPFRTGVISLPPDQQVWGEGDHAVRCYLWLDGANLTGTLKGKGVKSLPIQYK